MENKRYGGSAETREEALYGALKEFEKDILSEENCDRAFRIYEKSGENLYVPSCKEVVFKIDEIPLRLQEVVLPKKEDIGVINTRKYNLKERIKILLKGTI